MPPWVADGGTDKLLERLKDPAVRTKIKQEMATEHPNWENLYLGSGGASGVLVSGIVNRDPAIKKYDGKTLQQIASDQHKAPLDALFDLVLADKAQTGAIYFIASEDDLRYGLKQPWTSIGLDANEVSLDGLLFEPHNHPRAYGSMPRFLGHYVRDLHLLPLEQLSPILLADNLATQVAFARAVLAHDRAAAWVSINANQLPPSGSSIFHPHLQGGANPAPTTMQRLLSELPPERFRDYVDAERQGARSGSHDRRTTRHHGARPERRLGRGRSTG